MGDKPAEGPPIPRTISRRDALTAAGGGIAGGVAGFFLGKRSSGIDEQVQTPPVTTPIAAESTQPAQVFESHTFPVKRPDGTREFSLPITDDERKRLQEDVDIVSDAVKTLLDAATLEKSGINFDSIAQEMKAWDDKRLVDWSRRFNSDRIEGGQEQALFLQFGDTNVDASFVKDRKTGEVTYKAVGVSVDNNGNYYTGKDHTKPLTLDDLHALPSKLLSLIKPPQGAKPDYSHAKLTWKTGFYLPENSTTLQEHGSMSTTPYYTSDNKIFSMAIWGNNTSPSTSESVKVIAELHNMNAGPVYKGKGAEQP